MARWHEQGAVGPVGTEGLYQTLFDNMSEGFAVCEAIRDRRGNVTDYWLRAANPVYLRRGPEGTAIDRRQLEIRPTTSQAWFAACERALAGEPVRFEFREGVTGRWYDVHIMRLSDDEFAQFFFDITARKLAEQRQGELFDELNHRVKNNLAVVSSILELQARSSPAPVREQLHKAVDRIRSIADLHAALYRQSSTERVDICSYLEDLNKRLAQSLFHDSAGHIATICAPIALPVKEAVTLGLIVNELVTNAAKHAFEGSPGTISVNVSHEQDEIRVVVADNGKGLAEKDLERPRGLGLRVVRSLAEGVGGSVGLMNGPGAAIRVVLPDASSSSSSGLQQRLF